MITNEERKLTDEILDEGDRKYWEKAATLGEILGVDGLYGLDTGFNRIWRWLRDNRDRRKEFERHGLEIRMEDSSSAKIVVRRSKKRGDVDELGVSWWNQSGGGDVLHHHMTPGEYKRCYSGKYTATDAMFHVLAALRELDLWITVALAYKAVRADVDKAEEAKSAARTKKARHQLELLRKL